MFPYIAQEKFCAVHALYYHETGPDFKGPPHFVGVSHTQAGRARVNEHTSKLVDVYMLRFGAERLLF